MNLKQIKRWGPLVLILILAATAYSMVRHEQINLQVLQENKEGLLQFVSNRPFLTVFLYSLVYIGAVTLSLPIAAALTLLGGFLFGKWLGTLIVITSATIGATLLFLIARSSIGAALREKANPLYHKIEYNMQENAANYLLFLRLIPVFPFFLVNIVPALFNISIRVFIWTTFFGIIPGSFVYVNLGEALGDIKSLDDLVSTPILVAFGLLGFFTLLPAIYKQIKQHYTREEKP